MKKFNEWLEKMTDKIGYTRILYFLIAGFGVALMSVLGPIGLAITAVVNIVLVFLKEFLWKTDKKVDKYNIIAGVLGVLVATIWGGFWMTVLK